MKISKEKYEKALKTLPKLRQAEEIVKEWGEAQEAHPDTFSQKEVVQIERADGEFLITARRKDAQRKPVDT